jgi:hypothetical protein
MANFPYLGSWGMTDETDYRSILRDYDDGSFREYRKSTFKHRIVTIPFKSLSKTKRDAIEAFYIANRFVDITLYVWPEATAVGSGTSHTARMRGPLIFTNESSCRYSTQLVFKLLT